MAVHSRREVEEGKADMPGVEESIRVINSDWSLEGQGMAVSGAVRLGGLGLGLGGRWYLFVTL